MQTQLRLFDDWWKDVIQEKQREIYKKELEGIRETQEINDTFMWIKNPVVRIKTLKLNSERKWITYERATKAVPNTEKDGPDYYFIDNAKTELFEFESLIRRNHDLLGIEAYEDMGLTHYEEPQFPMDKIHFNECCTRNRTHLLAIYEKNKLDYKKDYWLSEDWLTKTLEIEYKTAQKLAYAFELMNLDKKTIIRLIYGYISDSKISKIKQKRSWRMKEYEKGNHMEAGMKDMKESGILDDFIEYIIDLADSLPKLKRNEVGSGETNANIGDPETIDWVKEATKVLQDEVPDKEEYEDRFNYGKDTVFGTHKLFYGEEGCSHGLLAYIKGCDRDELREMKSAMFPQRGAYGRYRKAEYWYLTGSQKSQVWRYIKDRDEELDNADCIEF